MEITFVWSWFSFIVGIGSTFTLAIVLGIVLGYKSYRRQKAVSESSKWGKLGAEWAKSKSNLDSI